MKRLFITYLLFATSLLANAQFSGKGTGTANDPYQISTPIHVDEIRNFAGVKDVYLILTDDIDMTDYITENYGDAGWYPIPDFQGVLNGCGYIISGLRINRPTLDYVGFFSKATEAHISNLRLEYSDDIISGGTTGALIASTHKCYIEKCGIQAKKIYVSSNIISSRLYMGGLIGKISGGTTLRECACDLMEICSSQQRIVSPIIGGLVGYVGSTYDTTYSIITDNRVLGNVGNFYSEAAGGIVGCTYMSSKIENNLFEGNVFSDSYVGGLLGYEELHSTPSCSANVIIADAINLSYHSGGIYRIGKSDRNADVTEYRTNRASMKTKLICDGKELTIEDNKYNGLSTGHSMLKQKSLYANMGWDMENVWNIDNGNSYPRLKWEVEKGLIKPTLTIYNGKDEINGGDIIRFIAEKKTESLSGGVTYTYYQCTGDEPTIINTSKQQQEVTVTVSSSDYKHLYWSGINGTTADMAEVTESRKAILESDGSLPLKLHATFSDGDFTIYTANVTVSCKDYTKSFTIEFVNENPNKPVCPTPTITYSDGELSFECDCEGEPLYHVSTTSPDVKDIEMTGNLLSFERTYNIEVYATASSYSPSDTARLTICWLDMESEDVNGIVEIKSIPVQLSFVDGSLQIKNVPMNAKIELYDLSGILVNSMIANTSTIVVDIPHVNDYLIIKINNKSFKCKI